MNIAFIFNFTDNSKTTQTLEIDKVDHLSQSILQTKRTLLLSGDSALHTKRIDSFRLNEGKFEKGADEITMLYDRAQHRKVLDDENNVFILSGKVNKK